MLRIFLVIALCSLYAALNYASLRYPYIPGLGLLVLWALILPGGGLLAALAGAFLAVERWSHRATAVLAALVFFVGCAVYSVGYIFTAWASV